MADQYLGQHHRNGIADLLPRRHETTFELEIVWESLDPCRLSRGDSVVECRVHEAALRWIDACRSHSRRRLGRIYPAVDVLVTVMVLMAVEGPVGFMSACLLYTSPSPRD